MNGIAQKPKTAWSFVYKVRLQLIGVRLTFFLKFGKKKLLIASKHPLHFAYKLLSAERDQKLDRISVAVQQPWTRVNRATALGCVALEDVNDLIK